MEILDSKKEMAAMQEQINQLRADVDRLKNLVLAIAEQVPAPSDPPQVDEMLSANGKTLFVYEPGSGKTFSESVK